jgi:secreted trypsin-like serine protease
MTQSGNILWCLVIVLLSIVQSSHQTVYPCNANASCGCSTNSATVNRIVGGESASSSTWGWAVSIYLVNRFHCGGSIVSSSWVVTAAHCVIGFTASQFTINAGSTIINGSTQSQVPSRVIVHPDYNPYTSENDIALFQLSSPLLMSDPNVSQICLPPVRSETLAAVERPPANTSVSNSFPSIILFNMYYNTTV